MITVNFNKLSIKPSDTMLDIGCGTGRHTCEISRFKGVTIIGADLNFDDLVEARNKMNFTNNCGESECGEWDILGADILLLPFKDQSFDHIICSEVMEHIPDDSAAAVELIRVLKPGGNLIISVPRYLPEKICWALSKDYYNANGGHVRIYKKEQIISIFENFGLKKWNMHFAHSIHTPYWWLKCLVGPNRNDSRPVNLYQRILEWDIMNKPKLTRLLDEFFNPLLGKSLVLYFKKDV